MMEKQRESLHQARENWLGEKTETPNYHCPCPAGFAIARDIFMEDVVDIFSQKLAPLDFHVIK